jgi:hypothetical protein
MPLQTVFESFVAEVLSFLSMAAFGFLLKEMEPAQVWYLSLTFNFKFLACCAGCWHSPFQEHVGGLAIYYLHRP